ncbi:hypothetical protein FSP39_020308 [Pinctada imbricata]|uniref:G-protein coupled receptors family 1 profile domain-containing protein n=1 Tax=Pinctada imbricata TaxID=66713 RepID=A0AA89C1T9_PINIB|nr:hypothetical protein FSP39_020308 [Pinctada imbricata]
MPLVDNREAFIHLVMQYIVDRNSTNDVDFTQPHVRRSLRYVYPLFMFLHSLVGLAGFIGNLAIIIVIGKRRLFKDPTFFFLGNIAFSDIIKCSCVLPITVSNLLIHNWIFGSFMCFFLPMLQCFPIHASILTYLVIAVDRYRLIVNPYKSRTPSGLCIIGVWVIAVCVVLPYAVYIKYIDLGAILGKRFYGVGICYVNQERNIEEYIRAMFVTLYAMPLAIIGFLYVRVSAEFKTQEDSSFSVHYNAPIDSCEQNEQPNNTIVNWDSHTSQTTIKVESENSVLDSRKQKDQPTDDSDDELDLQKERRTQSYLITMVTLFAICWCPMNILILVQYVVHENGDNTGHFDITYITFTLFGFLSTCVNPVLFASWRMSETTKDRLRGYFRFNIKRVLLDQSDCKKFARGGININISMERSNKQSEQTHINISMERSNKQSEQTHINISMERSNKQSEQTHINISMERSNKQSEQTYINISMERSNKQSEQTHLNISMERSNKQSEQTHINISMERSNKQSEQTHINISMERSNKQSEQTHINISMERSNKQSEQTHINISMERSNKQSEQTHINISMERSNKQSEQTHINISMERSNKQSEQTHINIRMERSNTHSDQTHNNISMNKSNKQSKKTHIDISMERSNK